MSFTSLTPSNPVDQILSGLALPDFSASYAGRSAPYLVPPSTDAILDTLCPTDAQVFRSALAGIPLISDTPPLPSQFLTPLEDTPSFLAGHHAKLLELGWAIETDHAKVTREDPVACYALFMRTGGILGRLGCIDDIRYAARAALRFSQEELDNEMRRAILNGTPSWATFKPLVAYRLACTVALAPLISLGPPPAEVVRAYSWTWRTCPNCVVHVQHGPGDACGVLCREAPWFVGFWKELVATLRACPDPDAVLGVQHLSQALQGAMLCPICSRVAFDHLRCFQGLLIVEAAKRIGEVSFEL